MWAALTIIGNLLVTYSPVLLPILAGVVGWLIPSPAQRAAKAQAEVHNAETNATNSGGDVGNLDNLP